MPNETISEFITALKKIAEKCEFPDLEDRLRDALVCGILNEEIQSMLLMNSMLTFKVAQEMALAHEAAVKNVAEIKNGKPQEEMNVMGRAVKVRLRDEKMIFKCFRCGNTNHREEKCFLKDKRCFKCQKLGHISRVCKNGNWRSDRNNCSIDEEAEATNGLLNVNQVNDTSNIRNYMVKVQTSGRDINMLIDSGTGKNIISEKTYIETWVKSERPRIEKDSTKLVQWNRQRLSILGKIKADVKVNKRNITMELLVVEGPGPNLIGREAFDQIGIGLEWINYGDSVCQITEEFMDVFKEKLRQYRGPPIHIKIKTLGKPTFLRARTLPYAIRPKVEEASRKMEEQGILTPVEFTRFATPIVPVLKRDGSIRICGDYRSTVNTIVESDTFPVPAVADLQVNLAGGKVFSKLDLKDAYQQLVVDEETAELLAINTHKGLFKVNRLPFGVSCAPGIFQRRMESLIAKIPGVVVYLDDILVTGKDEMEHDLRLREVLKSIQRMGLALKKEKCEFKKSSLIFLGCRIDAEGIHPTEEKCEAIKNFPKPENKKELQSFLGLLNFYSKFLKDRTTVLEPLHRLLNKRNCWKWKEVEDRAFREAKNLIQSDLVLTPYDARKPLVIIFGISKFYKYLYGRDFKIITDHKPLLGIFNPNKPIPQMLSPRMMRWSLTLASYSYQIEHRPGRMNANADALSRAPHEKTSKETPEPVDVFLIETNEESPLEAKEVAKLTQEDSVLGIIVEWTRIGWPAHCPAEKFRPYFNRRNELSLHRECLLWGNRVVIPPVLQRRTIEQLHETHPGIVQIKAIARSHVWWPGMDKAIENRVERCENCQLVRNNPKPSPVHPWTAPVKPWSRIHIDYAGPFHGRTFLIVVDSMSKWPEAIIMDHCTATATVRVLRNLFAVHGLPDQVVSDNGRMFVVHEFQEFLRMNGIRHITSAPYHPQTNGQAERVVQTLKQLIRKNGWENISVTLPRALFAMRTTPHGTTGLTPAELLMGRRLTTRMNRLHPKESEDSENGKEHFQNRFKSQENVYARKYNGKGKWEPGKIKTVLGPRNYEVIMENGVTAKRHQDQLMRRVKEEVSEDVEKKEECNTERRGEQMNDPNESPERLEETPGPSRPIRNRRLPEYLKDCVTNWGWNRVAEGYRDSEHSESSRERWAKDQAGNRGEERSINERCSFGELKEELIRDRLVVGERNLALSEKLQLIPDSTMDKAIEIAKQTEAVRMQQKSLRDDCLAETNVNFVKKQNKGNFSKIKGSNLKHDESSIPGNSKACICATCRRCSKKGHFMKQCKTKLVSQVTTIDDNEKFLENFCIDQISSDERWNYKVAVNKRIMPFQIDTGADVSVMPENCFKQNFSHKLGKTQKRLYAAGMAMPVLGNFQATLEANGKVSHEEIFVVKNLHVSLLSAKASEELGFIQRLLHVNSNPLTDPLKDYPKLFSGLGKLNKPYKIELNDQAQPYAIHTPRRIPFPLMNKTKQKLKEMEQQGGIEKVDHARIGAHQS
ncbi:K02A2.6-like [Cordylochernes scorpioides]|uniref:RNA-directed DNA polymerase n=1 Tax=Cordylochernes scorpioides TaxID=51811 RepID=A0ABY6LQQ0_9ARAC|nr:K02A2.6-like [Cordylochernes scorpioides]